MLQVVGHFANSKLNSSLSPGVSLEEVETKKLWVGVCDVYLLMRNTYYCARNMHYKE